MSAGFLSNKGALGPATLLFNDVSSAKNKGGLAPFSPAPYYNTVCIYTFSQQTPSLLQAEFRVPIG